MSMSGSKTLSHQLSFDGVKLCLGMEGSKLPHAGKASAGAISFLHGARGGTVCRCHVLTAVEMGACAQQSPGEQ